MLPLKIKSKKCTDLKVEKIEFLTSFTFFAWVFDVDCSGYIYIAIHKKLTGKRGIFFKKN